MQSINNYFLKSKKIGLRAIEKKDTPIITKWLNDEIVTYFMFYGQRPTNEDQIAEEIQKQINSQDNIVFLIVNLRTKKPIGFAGLYGIHPTARKAEFRILIGEKNFWGKGYGTEVTELVTYYGFDRLNLNKIWLGYEKENKAAGITYERAGYSYEGISKEDIYRNSRYYDGVRMAILRRDYYEKFFKEHLKRFKPKWDFSKSKRKNNNI